MLNKQNVIRGVQRCGGCEEKRETAADQREKGAEGKKKNEFKQSLKPPGLMTAIANTQFL